MIYPHQLGAEGATDLWKLALQDGYVLSLFKDVYIFNSLTIYYIIRHIQITSSVMKYSKNSKFISIQCFHFIYSTLFFLFETYDPVISYDRNVSLQYNRL